MKNVCKYENIILPFKWCYYNLKFKSKFYDECLHIQCTQTVKDKN